MATSVTLSRPGGLTLSPPSMALDVAVPAHDQAPRKAAYPALIMSDWGAPSDEGFTDPLSQTPGCSGSGVDRRLRRPARADRGPCLPLRASWSARVSATRRRRGQRHVRPDTVAAGRAGASGSAWCGAGLDRSTGRGHAGFLVRRPGGRSFDQGLAGLAGRRAGRLGRGPPAFAAGAAVIDQFPTEWRARFGAAHAMAALETGDLDAARALLAYSFSQNAPAADQLTARLVQSRLFELDGQTDRALAVYKAVARAPLDGIATPAKLGVIRIELAKGTLTPVAAAAQLEQLKWRWRGDATELSIIRTLGGLYLSQGPVSRGAGYASGGRQAAWRPAWRGRASGRPVQCIPGSVPRRCRRRLAAGSGAGAVL